MKVSLNWLKDFVDINVSLDELCKKLVSAGFEVEEVIEQGKNFRNVVLGKLEKVVKHPDADKLKICSVNAGKDELVQIVTGASNIAEGDIVPVALDNSLLPTGQVIKKGKLRGVESNGMLCSGEELMLTEADYKGASVYGILIMNGETAPLGTDITQVLGYDDVILDIGVTANRSDCNSVLGIAREVSTVLGVPLKMPNLEYQVEEGGESEVKVDVIASDLCPRYMAQVVKDIKITSSAPIIQKRLKAVGLRPINNIVDITNYVLVEIGQPMHAFDLALLDGKNIVVRRANNGEKITALDGNEYTLDDSILAICDQNKPVAVAGIMGGEYSGINENTQDIVFESAKFLRDNVRRSSRKLNLRSDSSFRYERGIDFESQSMGLRRALSLISQYGYGKIVGDTIDKKSVNLEEKTIQVPTAKINAILGIEVPEQTMVDILNSLQIKTMLKDGVLTCVQPFFRDDIENANDLAEEIIRLYGYDHINCTLMDGAHQTSGGKTEAQINVDKLKEIAVSQGMNEILTYSFTSPKSFDTLRLAKDSPLRNAVKLLNPLGEDVSVMRTTLVYSMMSTLAKNCLKSNKSARLFEIAHVYEPNQDATIQPNETTVMALGMYGDCDYYTIKGVIEIILRAFGIKAEFVRSSLPYMHSGRSADVMVGSHRLGYLGEVHPSVAGDLDVKERMYVAELDVDLLNKIANLGYKFSEIAKYPPVERDIAVVLDEDKMAADIIKCIKKAGGNMLVDCSIFDIYRNKEAVGENKKSVAINLVFRLADRTLTEEEVNAKIEKILKKLDIELGATLR